MDLVQEINFLILRSRAVIADDGNEPGN